MKPSELSAEQLATLIDVTMRSEHDETELDTLLVSYGIEPEGDGSIIFIEIACRLRSITALEDKIKGMIVRPKVEVLSHGEVLINGMLIGRNNAVNQYLYQDTLQALGLKIR